VAPDSFFAVAENYLARHVRANGLRSESEITRILQNQVYPMWKERAFEDIRRGDVARLLDTVQDTSGPGAADHALAVVRGVMNWHESRSDDYTSPIARNMRRTDAKARKRSRILDDAELRAVWAVAKANGTFGAIVRLALLTAQRREKLAALKWEDVTVDGVWNIATEEREKGNAGALVLPDAALDIIRSQPRVGDNPYVFAGRGDGHFRGYSPCKRKFDKQLADLPRWTLHDLRRTARSLMARAGVRPDVGERVLGHVLTGVEGIYDRHTYRDEKAEALRRLAGLVETILNPPAGENVVPLKADAQ
jgi:integrase